MIESDSGSVIHEELLVEELGTLELVVRVLPLENLDYSASKD